MAKLIKPQPIGTKLRGNLNKISYESDNNNLTSNGFTLHNQMIHVHLMRLINAWFLLYLISYEGIKPSTNLLARQNILI